MIAAIDIASMIISIGGTPFECDVLLAVAWAESRYNEQAVGDSGWSHGLFQAERQAGISVKKQVANALSRLREQHDYFVDRLQSMSSYVDCSPEMIMRFHRAAWQTHPKMPNNWLSWVNNQIFDLKEQHERLGFQLTDEEILEAISGERKKLDVWDMIIWAGNRNVNAQALLDGQQQITNYLSSNKLPGIMEAGGGAKTWLVLLGGFVAYLLFKRWY